MENNTLTALSGVSVGHATHIDKLTGTTIVLFDKDYPVAYQSYGGSTGTFNTDTFRNGKTDYRAHGIFISGGSWAGLQAAGSIMSRMIETERGYKAFKIINPNLTGAIVFDLGTRIDRYNPEYGKEAVDNATKAPVLRGNVGAGTGTSVGKFRYFENGTIFAGMKAGVGCAKISMGNGVIITAMSVVNAVGNIVLPNGTFLAGNRIAGKPGEIMPFEQFEDIATNNQTNTTITIVGINANLHTREHYERVAHLATHGQVRAINPVNTSLDGDSVFVFSTEELDGFLSDDARRKARGAGHWADIDVDVIGQAAAKAVQESIYDACYQAETISFEGALDGVVPAANINA
ncbi:MAG: P1 family peptidase [Patescibacteria group bacterium]